MFKEIRDLKPVSISVSVLTLVASWLLTLSLGMTIVGARASETDAGEQFSSLGGMQIALTCMSVLMCLPSVVKVAIRRDARRIALWQVVGASPRGARARYIGIATFSAVAGAAAGGLIAFVTWPTFGAAVKRTGLLTLPGFSEPLTVWAWIFGPASACVVLLVSLLMGTRQLKKIEPVEAVMDLPERAPSRGIVRLIFSVLIISGIAAGYVAIGATSPPDNMETLGGLLSAYWGTALGLLVAYGVSDRVVITPIVRVVGAIIPLNALDSWVLAKTSARRRSTLSTSVITPLVVAASSVGCIFGMVNQMRNVMVASGASEADLQVSPSSQIILIFGAPVIISAFSGVIAVYLTNEWRRHDVALLQTLGATTSAIRWSAFFECVIYLVSAVLIATMILGVNAVAMGCALNHGPVPGASPVWIGNETYWLLAAGFSLLGVSIILPTVRESRKLTMTAIVR
ncbi:ABC transporter permease [Corynebacterium kroppenstedtii]|uniref:ABC transporter permease n=1 Tax=Corynebacterium sp. PCR 32 TaxID=3351342 RepID=UPI00309498D6